MKKALSSLYAIVCYTVGFVSLLYWIASTGNLFPETSIDGIPTMKTSLALLKNFALILLFALQHSVMARKGFKKWITQYIPSHIERSTYVLATGIVVILMVWQWEPLGGVIWDVRSSTLWYNIFYALYFIGWIILFISTFLINHFDLFGLRQAYQNLISKPYHEVDFKIISFYKYTRHPLYLGAFIGIWSTPLMTSTHLIYAIMLTAYIFIGIHFEEKDLVNAFGDKYLKYKATTPMLLPIKKRRNNA
jgi:protein-S-isoprenylcysteine O-methyltransferase Ste14